MVDPITASSPLLRVPRLPIPASDRVRRQHACANPRPYTFSSTSCAGTPRRRARACSLNPCCACAVKRKGGSGAFPCHPTPPCSRGRARGPIRVLAAEHPGRSAAPCPRPTPPCASAPSAPAHPQPPFLRLERLHARGSARAQGSRGTLRLWVPPGDRPPSPASSGGKEGGRTPLAPLHLFARHFTGLGARSYGSETRRRKFRPQYKNT